ncbi:histidine kinase [Streptosporangium sp. NPDC051022]|uniref:sensor histidine kinase n=1 Tax=Streptosporangium sp. NPDC051022 TaxID=3155752 RepID=UPI00343CF3A1
MAAYGRRLWRRYLRDALRPAGEPVRPSRRAVAADVLLAVVLAVVAVVASMNFPGADHGDHKRPQSLLEALRLHPALPTGLDVWPPETTVRPVPPPAPDAEPLPVPPRVPGAEPLPVPPSVPGAEPLPVSGAEPLPVSDEGPLPVPPPAEPLVPGTYEPSIFLVLLTALPLAVRRRYPLAVFWTVLAAALVTREGVTWITVLACAVAAYSAVAHSRNRIPALAGLLLAAVLAGAAFRDVTPQLPSWLGPFVVLLGAGVSASLVHFWQRRLRASRRRLDELRRTQEEATRRAVEAERARIAGELHDVVTHNVSVMVIQAGAARKVMEADPKLSEEALLAIEASGRTALAELRHVMGLLSGPDSGRYDAVDDGLEPQPGLDQLDTLVERIRAAGTPVDVTLSPPPGPLSPGVDLAAYRVVQEALTNTLKHASGAAASVVIGHDGDWLEIEVTDTGGNRAASSRTVPSQASFSQDPLSRTGAGRGLIGLRERLALYGGTLDAGPGGGGYRLVARLPWTAA